MSEPNEATVPVTEAWVAKGLWQYTAHVAIPGTRGLTIDHVGPHRPAARAEVLTDGPWVTLRLADDDGWWAERSVRLS